MIDTLKKKVLNQEKITQEEALLLSKTPVKEALYKAADDIRTHFCKNIIDLCSITNARSGKCTQDCKWCSQSVYHKTNIEEYEIVDSGEAIDRALQNAAQGVKRYSLVTSGRRVSNKTLGKLIPIYKEIKEKSEISLCASLGLVDEYQMLRLRDEAGIEHYHCNLETAPSYFHKVVGSHTIEDKIRTIKMAKKLGIRVCSGGIIGMGETMEQRIELAFTLQELGVHSIPLNILQAIENTPMEGYALPGEEEILTTIALFRFINPEAQLRFAGGRMQIKHFQEKALRAGISAAITGDYLTSAGSNIQEDIRDFTKAGFSIDNEQHRSISI